MLLSIDPGLSKCGVALFNDAGELVAAYTAHRPKDCRARRGVKAWAAMGAEITMEGVSALAIEQMQVDTRTRGKERDLLEVCGVVGVLVGIATARGIPVHGYKPRAWKGNAPKQVTKNRSLDALSPQELKNIHPRATHDAFDAIGIAQFHLEQLKK